MPRFGYRSFDTSDHSRNNYLIGVVGFGEGYHNNHHAQPRCAAHGLRWWEFDLTRYVIWLLEKCGLAWDVVWPETAKAESLPAHLSESGDANLEVEPSIQTS
jgi:stearoyl-CoA desaturase (delta-9 desaturase)